MSNNTYKLPKHIAQMVEKNNLVVAIKTLAEESNISMGEAKGYIDDYEAQLKAKQALKTQKIVSKQNILSKQNIVSKQNKSNTIAKDRIIDTKHSPSNSNLKNSDHLSQNGSKFDSLNTNIDNHLDSLGYKKPLVPYWVKRVSVILIVIALLSLVFWQLMG